MGALLPNIDPIARAVIHFQFMHTLADGTTIAKLPSLTRSSLTRILALADTS